MRPPRGSGGSCRTLLAQTSGSQNLRMSDPEPCSSNAHTLQMGKLRHTEKAGRGGAGSEVEDSEVYLCLQETQKPPLPPPRPQIPEGGAGRARRGRDPGPADPRRGAAGPGSHCPAAVSLSVSFSFCLSLLLFWSLQFCLFIFCLCFCHCCLRPISVSVSPRVSPSLLVPVSFSRPQRRRDPPTRHPGGRTGAQSRRLAGARRPGAAGGLRWARDQQGRRVLPAGFDVRSWAPGGVRGCGVRGAAFRRGTRVPPPLSAAICRHLTAFHLRSDWN